MDSFVSLAYASLAASRTLPQRLLACLNFTFYSENLSFCYKHQKRFLRTMAAAQAAKNHGDEWGFDLILVMRDIYINSNLNHCLSFTISWNITTKLDQGVTRHFKKLLLGGQYQIHPPNNRKSLEPVVKIIQIPNNRANSSYQNSGDIKLRATSLACPYLTRRLEI